VHLKSALLILWIQASIEKGVIIFSLHEPEVNEEKQ
jgi:hypothetical protein